MWLWSRITSYKNTILVVIQDHISQLQNLGCYPVPHVTKAPSRLWSKTTSSRKYWPNPVLGWLEVNKCAFTFSSEIRQIQCTRTEFWCVQCPRPAGPSALDKHQIQSSALDLSYFTSKSTCKFINLIHTRQKNKIICSCLWKIINKMALKCHKTRRILTNFTQWKKWISRCDVLARDHAPKAPRAV